uniref:Peptidase S1 domain-containing protein n=1 Tax=Panagrolaimus sp. JU765 TaxID=591449 RepID=A0AC34RK11_9BILA
MLAIILLALFAVSSAEDRIHNGKEAEPDLNNVVYLMSSGCTGTVVSEHYILTAAHCVPPSPEIVRIYTRDLYHHDPSKLPTPAFQSSILISHPEYCKRHDIALIKVATPMTIPPVPLAANYSHPKDDWLRVAGYGRTKYQIFNASTGDVTSFENPKTLMETYLQARSTDDCFNESFKIAYPDWHLICMYKNDSTVLHGDSGGPAFAQGKDGRYYQVGVNVHGLTWGGPTFSFWKMPLQSPFTIASLSTDVSYYCPWIEQTTKGEVKCQPFKSTPIVPKF